MTRKKSLNHVAFSPHQTHFAYEKESEQPYCESPPIGAGRRAIMQAQTTKQSELPMLYQSAAGVQNSMMKNQYGALVLSPSKAELNKQQMSILQNSRNSGNFTTL